jgi:hypothetical protein
MRNLGHYRDSDYIQKLEKLSIAKGWKIQFEDGKIVITEETLDDILTLLQNKRLHS